MITETRQTETLTAALQEFAAGKCPEPCEGVGVVHPAHPLPPAA